jgi:dihydroneopterin aldolase
LELLAWDSAAWRLAALMDEVSVVGSRTEMDWGVGQGQVNVWAPMKLILDSPTPPQSYDIVSLANWIADVTQGTIVCLGCKVCSHIAVSEPDGFLELP